MHTIGTDTGSCGEEIQLLWRRNSAAVPCVDDYVDQRPQSVY